ncbi:universal stress protein [Halobacteria archaeon AArc-dxtr1]|nr:universal stress protein [Halobacteria archaeon AArc-dxtr1]
MPPHVLLPVDGSESAQEAIEFAAASVDASAFTLIHVVTPTQGVEGNYYGVDLHEQAVERGEQLCEDAHDELANALDTDDVAIDTTVETGRPAPTIVAYAADNDVDHIVMGSTGRSGLSRVLLGSVAETVVRRATVPVTVVR